MSMTRNPNMTYARKRQGIDNTHFQRIDTFDNIPCRKTSTHTYKFSLKNEKEELKFVSENPVPPAHSLYWSKFRKC